MLYAGEKAPKYVWKNTFEIGQFGNGFITFDDRVYRNHSPLIERNNYYLGIMLYYPGLWLYPDGALIVLTWKPLALGIYCPI